MQTARPMMMHDDDDVYAPAHACEWKIEGERNWCICVYAGKRACLCLREGEREIERVADVWNQNMYILKKYFPISLRTHRQFF